MTERGGEDQLVLEAENVRAVVDPLGSRVVSLRVHEDEMLVQPGDDRLLSGCYPMAPWAGRLGRGRFVHDGLEVAVPVDLPPHAIHGLGTAVLWASTEDGFELDLIDRWALGGTARTAFLLDRDSLTMRLTFTADASSAPVVLGWHPCFRRRIGVHTPPVRLEFEADHWWPRGGDGLPAGNTEPPPDGPWDDCFGGVADPPVLSWPEGPTLTLRADTTTWVVYDEPDHAVCVEPQAAPPDAFNLGLAPMVEPGMSIHLVLTVDWSPG